MTTTMLVIFLIALFLNVPIGIALGLSSIIVLTLIGNVSTNLIANIIYGAANSFMLIAVTFFMLAGNLMKYGGISRRIVAFAKALVGSFTGGLGAVTVLACMMVAAMSGSGPATIAAVGMIMIPSMVKEGYDIDYACGLTATSGGLGIVIPPSIPLVIYGTLTGASIGALFLGGIVPGIIMGVLTMFANYIISKRRGYRGETKGISIKELLVTFKDAFWALLMPLIILGGIYSGIFTPTEAACVAVIYGFIIGFFVYRELKISDLKTILLETGVISAISLIVITLAAPFGYVLTVEKIPTLLTSYAQTYFTSYITFLLILNGIFLFIGCFMSSSAALIILAPLLAPIAAGFGIDLVHLGLILIICLEIGMMTPPFGVNLLVTASVGGTTYDKVSKGALPFIFVDITALFLITFLPILVLWLPRIMGY